MADWACRRTGDCCRQTETVTLRPGELERVRAARPDVEPIIVERRADGTAAIAAGPCPYLDGDACSVYAVRPWICRVWACFRTEAQYREQVPATAALMQARLAESAGARRVWRRMVEEVGDV